MNTQKGLTPILIVLVIALTVGGYLIYQKQLKPVTTTPQPSPSPATSLEASSSAETTNWGTYTNKAYQFKVDYPLDWYVLDSISGTNTSSNNRFTLDRQLNIFTSESTLNRVNINDPIGTKKEIGDKIFEEKVANLTLDGKPAAKFKVDVLSGSQTDALPNIMVKIALDKEILHLRVYTLDAKNYNDTDKVFNQILSTFRFD